MWSLLSQPWEVDWKALGLHEILTKVGGLSPETQGVHSEPSLAELKGGGARMCTCSCESRCRNPWVPGGAMGNNCTSHSCSMAK